MYFSFNACTNSRSGSSYIVSYFQLLGLLAVFSAHFPSGGKKKEIYEIQ
jgi:hypothetical protein